MTRNLGRLGTLGLLGLLGALRALGALGPIRRPLDSTGSLDSLTDSEPLADSEPSGPNGVLEDVDILLITRDNLQKRSNLRD